MLGNNADQFFTTPMRTSVLAGGNAAFAAGGGMPAPFLPMGNDAVPVAVAAETKKFLGVGMPVILGLAAFAFLALKR